MNDISKEKELDIVIENIKAVLEDSPPVLKPVMEHIIQGEGKNVRADLIIKTAKTLGDVSENVVNIATSVEILHLSTLIHDDIIDDAKLRRGRESVQAKFGKKIAVIAGDYLFTKCFKLVAKNNQEFVEDFSNAVSAICIGEVLQTQHLGDFDITKKQYHKIISGKTASLFALATYSSAKSCTSSEKIARGYGRIGYSLGIVFQLIDDCLDYDGSTEKTRKNLYKDLEDGVITFPLIHAIDKNPKMYNLLNKEKNSENIANIANEVKKIGGLEAAREETKIYYDKTKAKILKYCPVENSHYLYNALDNIYYREH